MSKFDILSAVEAQSSSATSTHGVEIWLDDQPLPADYEAVADGAAARSSDKKRQPATHKQLKGRRKKHQKLSEIPVNIMSSSEGRITRSKGAKLKESPAKHQSKSRERVPSTPKNRRRESDEWEDPTPKAQVDPFVSKPPLPTPSRDDRQPSHASSAASSSVHPDSSVSNVSKRSKSPTKRDFDLKLTDISVDWKLFSYSRSSLSKKASDLLRDLERIADGRQVIPIAVENMFKQYMKDVANKELDDHDPRLFSSPDSAGDLSPKPGDLSHEVFFDMAVRVLRAAGRCRVHEVSEPQWNSAVHFRILDLALESSWLPKGVWFQDISAARITDESLLPRISSQSKVMQSQMVDYAMVIQPSEALEERIRSKLVAKSAYSINQTDTKSLRFSPIALSIETKRAAIEEDKARTQLEAWVSAHFAKLRQLIGGDSTVPFLPLIMAQGNKWHFLIAEMADRKGPAGVKKRIFIYEDHELGHTKSLLGVYQLLAAIQRLAKWIDEEYRPWFESQVLGMESEQNGNRPIAES
ncbi:MAG: hypothetical protein Q9191_003850 [Dirinaria sp. TL-2023a]